jgi:general secretion pathway protein A
MYMRFYGFKERPFTLTPDPRFLFLSEDHFDALEHLLYGISGGEGFLLLTGEVGTGKTTLCRALIDRLQDRVVSSLILNPFQDYPGLLKNILWDFSLIPEGLSVNEMTNQLIEFLLNEVAPKGKTALIIIDEAQNLDDATLEQLRVLSNVETDREKLLQILLLGQEELVVKLGRTELRQLNQRISVRFFLTPLKKKEVGRYLSHRLGVGDPVRKVHFTASGISEIYRFSRGVPRLINMLAHRTLLAGFVKGSDVLDRALVRRAGNSLFGEKPRQFKRLLNRVLGTPQTEPDLRFIEQVEHELNQ